MGVGGYRWIVGVALGALTACAAEDADDGVDSGATQADHAVAPVDDSTHAPVDDSADAPADDGDPSMCPPVAGQSNGCPFPDCCDDAGIYWTCNCYAQCEDNCCTYEPSGASYCIFSGGQYSCGAGSSFGDACQSGIEAGAACDPEATPGCCDDALAWTCECEGDACSWVLQDCGVSPQCR